MPDNQPKKNDSAASSYMKYSGLGFQMIAIIGAFTYGGYRIDESTHHDVQWVTATMALLGVFISLFIVIRSLRGQ